MWADVCLEHSQALLIANLLLVLAERAILIVLEQCICMFCLKAMLETPFEGLNNDCLPHTQKKIMFAVHSNYLK